MIFFNFPHISVDCQEYYIESTASHAFASTAPLDHLFRKILFKIHVFRRDQAGSDAAATYSFLRRKADRLA